MIPWSWRTRNDGIIEVDRHLGNGFGVPTLAVADVGIASDIARTLQCRVLVEQVAGPHGMSVPWCLGVIFAESGGRQNAVSPVGARGLMQIMPTTGKGLGVANPDDLFVPAINVDAGSRYLMSFAQKGRDVVECASMYNAGPTADFRPKTRSVTELFPWGFVENTGYITRVVAATNHFTKQLGYSGPPRPAASRASLSLPMLALGGFLAWKYLR